MTRGEHAIKTWSTTQSVIALPSGEAEYCGMVKGDPVGLGLKADLSDFGVEVGLKIKKATPALQSP